MDIRTGLFRVYENLSAISNRAAYAEFFLSRLYTVSVNGDEIFEYDAFNGGLGKLIQNTSRSIGKGTGLGDLRLARNGLIYVQSTNSNTLHTIDNKTSLENISNFINPAVFKTNALSIGNGSGAISFPNTIASFNQLRLLWGYGNICFGDPIVFHVSLPNSIDSIKWDFDDPASGITNFSKEFNPTHIFKTQGKNFDVKVTAYAKGYVEQGRIPYEGGYTSDLGRDTTLCFNANQKLILKPNLKQVGTFKWQDGSTNPTYLVTKPGIYWLEIKQANSNCTFRDSIVVKSYPVPLVNLGNDTTICTGKTLMLKAANPGSTYKWQDGTVKSTFLVSAPGIYKVTVTNTFGCISSDSIKVHYLTPPALNLGKDTTICSGTEFILNGNLPGVTYKWQDGSTGSTFKVTKAGTYWVDATIDICTAWDSIVVKTRKGCFGDLFIPNIITPNGDGINDAFVLSDPDKSSIWQLEVFNRFGTLVYKSKQYDNKWNALNLAAGVYYYLLQDDKNRKLKGYVEIVK